MLLALLPLLFASPVLAPQAPDFDETLYSALEYRCAGPFRGGRSAAICGVPGDPMTYYFGAAGGGVWKTSDGGQTWENVSDGFFGGSIGAVEVCAADPNVIYAGGGEVTVRGNVSSGFGVWKSEDRGKTWRSMGLADTRHIPRIRSHPKNPNIVFVAALGHLYGPNEERGVYRSVDGGENWERVLFANADAGAIDLSMDPSNPRVLFASTWRIRRTPHSLESGGDGSALWHSTDGGDTWADITHNEGLPEGMVGIIGVCVSPVNPERVWAIIEADDGGVFRSDDGGETWERVNEQRTLRQRAWYYSRIFADTQDEDRVWVTNVRLWQSKDGGKSFESVSTPHGDHHDLWIAPEDGDRVAVADDGGGQVSINGGERWSTYRNQPTSQFYRVTTDGHFPYRILGAQQDNSTVRLLHRSAGSTIGERDWEPTAGGESGWIAPHPEDPEIVYGGSYGGYLTRRNHRTGEVRSVNVWPDDPMGHGAEGMNPRFQWNFPILFSRHDPNVLLAAGNRLFETTDEGQSWAPISPDLTRADPATLVSSGGPITKDNTGVEYYATIFAVAESLHVPGVLWAGSDDGLIHITRNAGASWQNITPPLDLLPEWTQINSIEAHPTEPGGAYVAGTRYKSDDFAPYLLRTLDYGATWTRIDEGIDALHFTRVIRADPGRPGLLYAGTESGMYISFDDGAHWKPFQLNLPTVPITDLAVRDDDLVVATQGRSFWVLDDLTPLHQLNSEIAEQSLWLYTPRPTLRMGGGRNEDSVTAGMNPRPGVVFNYLLDEELAQDELLLEILELDGTVVRSFHSKPAPASEENDELAQDAAADDDKDSKDEKQAKETKGDGEDDKPLPSEPGMNRYEWDMRYPEAEEFDGLVLWSGGVRGPRAVPGSYQARLTLGEQSMTVPIEIQVDPRSSCTHQDLQAQFDLLIEIRDKVSEAHLAIQGIRDLRGQIEDLTGRLGEQDGADEISEAAEALLEQLVSVETTLYQTQNQSPQDPLNFPIRLTDKLGALASGVSRGDWRPTDQALAVYAKLAPEVDVALASYSSLLETTLPSFNALVREHAVPRILLEKP
ncbi:MAG: photosystem II stability/assembly factor-like uncharacterized protein [Chlamydiales bacterium]|jgi:photosystem II stability/assembly factor-like uncharacterized protein